MKQILRNAAQGFGYEIRKAPFGFKPAPIFRLAIEYLIATRGPSLRFIQVGANDGQSGGDPLRPFVLAHPWRGILVEPQAEAIDLLRKNYAGLEDRLIFENVAIASHTSGISLYRGQGTFEDGRSVLNSTVASPNRAVVARQLGMKPEQMEAVLVPTVRLDHLIEKYSFEGFEILQIDTEGYDWQVLQTIDLVNTQPLLIQFEHGHLSPADIGAIASHLNEHGYSLHFGGHQSDSLAIHGSLFDA
jgi:FkbM family methyltransferase